MDRHHFDTDADPDPNFQFDAAPDPDPDPALHMLKNIQNFKTFIRSNASLHCFIFLISV